MGENSKIEWTDHTFNPWHGCAHRTLGDRVHPGCEHCYAERQAKRNPAVLGTWGDEGTRILASESKWKFPAKWNAWAREGICPHCYGRSVVQTEGRCRRCNGTGRVEPYRAKVFCASIADVFEDWKGPILNPKDENVLVCDNCGKLHIDDDDALSESCDGNAGKCGRLKLRMDWAHMGHVRARLFRLIDETPHLDWQLLTKRPENVRQMWPRPKCFFCDNLAACYGRYADQDKGFACDECCGHGCEDGHCVSVDGKDLYRPNVWLGTSISDQATADALVPELLKSRELCPVLFLSAEPLIGPVDLIRCGAIRVDEYPHRENWPHEHRAEFHWLIAGGESGGQARPCHPDWIRSLRDQCAAGGVPFFFKQWGEFAPVETLPECAEVPHTILAGTSHEMTVMRRPSQSFRYVKRDGADRIFKADGTFTGEGPTPDDACMSRVGKAKAGRELDGKLHSAFPQTDKVPS